MNLKCIGYVLLFMPAISFAFEPLNTDDAGTVKAGGNQIEQYFFIISRNNGAPNQADIVTPGEEYVGQDTAKAFPFTYTRGLSETTEASFSATYYQNPKGNYSKVANYVFSTKWRFYEDEGRGIALALKPMLTLPSSKQQQVAGLGLAATNYGMNFIASKYWGDIELHVNASYMRSPYNTNYSIGLASDPNRTNIYILSLAPVWTLSKDFKVAFDIGASTTPPTNEQYLSHYSLIAAIYSLSDEIDLGISYMRTGTNYSETFAVQQAGATRSEIGITWRF
jgi:hypothetical protein